ncbi:MAG: OmpA family protein [Proteobacteria bacterium]|nr:OmpA family protein [Pseudomonadota bacterium]
MKTAVISLSLLLLLGSTAVAEDLNFRSTSEGIIQQLKTKDKGGGQDDSGMVEMQSGESMSFQTNTIKVVEDKDYAEAVLDSAKKEDSRVNLKVEFDINSFAVRPESSQILVELANAMKSQELQGQTFTINGHTDSVGSEEYNRNLSLSRAETIKQFLTANGIEEARIKTAGFGEENPLVENDTPENRQLNRRVEIVAE